MSRKWRQPKAGEWVRPVPDGYLFRCCDCALVHSIDFRVVNGDDVEFRVYRAKRETKKARKQQGVTLKTVA